MAMALMIVSVSMGVAITASLVTISLDVKGKVSKELRAFGANIVVEPALEGFADIAGQRRYLMEEDIVKAKTIFWRHNIVGIAPFLEGMMTLTHGDARRDVRTAGAWFDGSLPLPGEVGDFKVGISTVFPWWAVEGKAPLGRSVLLGTSLASETAIKAGDEVFLDGKAFTVSGILSTGGKEDTGVMMDMDVMQEMTALEGRVSRVFVSALTTPMDDFAYKNPSTMSPKEYEKWYCTGYVTSISSQLQEVFSGSKAKPIWQVAETEGRVLERLSILIYLLSAFALVGSALGVSTTMIASLLKRVEEVGVLKSVGADSFRISLIFLSEAFIIGLAGGVVGYALSVAATGFIGVEVFDTVLTQRAMLFPVSLSSALFIALLGSFLPIRKALGIKPAVVLKGAL